MFGDGATVLDGLNAIGAGEFAVVAAGFECADYEAGVRAELLTGWPEAADMIAALTA